MLAGTVTRHLHCDPLSSRLCRAVGVPSAKVTAPVQEALPGTLTFTSNASPGFTESGRSLAQLALVISPLPRISTLLSRVVESVPSVTVTRTAAVPRGAVVGIGSSQRQRSLRSVWVAR